MTELRASEQTRSQPSIIITYFVSIIIIIIIIIIDVIDVIVVVVTHRRRHLCGAEVRALAVEQ
jgi:hypothetical protein